MESKRDRIQLDFLVPGFTTDHPYGIWDSSPSESSATSSGPSRITEIPDSVSSDSPDHGDQHSDDIDAKSVGGALKDSRKGSHSGSSNASSGIRKGRGKQAFRHRKSHIKSKNGCFSCKERRVKCDEAQPECQNCVKRSLTCEYPPPPSAPEIVFAQPFVVPNDKQKSTSVLPVAIRKLEKSLKPIEPVKPISTKTLEFRMSKYNQIPVQVGMPDLRLMQNFTMNASQTLILGPNTGLWRRDAAELAFKHNFLMHALLMFSARHLVTIEPKEKQHRVNELQHRQHALGTLRLTLSDVGVTASNYDALIAANTLLAFHSCADYDENNPDAVADEYLPLMNGVKNIVKEMWMIREKSMFGNLLAMPLTMDSADVNLEGLEIMELLGEDDGDYLAAVDPVSLPDLSAFTEEQIQEFIKNPPPRIPLMVVDAISNYNPAEHASVVYKKVLLSLLPLLEAVMLAPRSIHMDLTSNISCALIAWPAMQPDRYVEMVQQRDPIALIIMAHYYAAMCHLDLDKCWWLKGRPRAMCQAICRELGDQHPRYMRWPREACGYNKRKADGSKKAAG